MKFSLYDKEVNILVDRVMQFQHLGRMLEETESEWLAVHRNTSKAQTVCRRLVNMLQWEGSDSWVSDLFYRDVIQAVLLFRSDSRALSDAMVRAVEGTHMEYRWQITGKRARRQTNGNW